MLVIEGRSRRTFAGTTNGGEEEGGKKESLRVRRFRIASLTSRVVERSATVRSRSREVDFVGGEGTELRERRRSDQDVHHRSPCTQLLSSEYLRRASSNPVDSTCNSDSPGTSVAHSEGLEGEENTAIKANSARESSAEWSWRNRRCTTR